MAKRGIALITTLMMLTIMMMMMGAWLTRSFGEGVIGHGSLSQQKANYAAESGLAVAMSNLGQSSAWASTTAGNLSDGSNYLIDFSPGVSVNNLAGTTAVAGPRGAATVAPHSAYLTVIGRDGNRTRRLEAVLVPGVPVAPLNSALRASGNIILEGDVQIDGVTSFADATPVRADLVSNSASNATGVIRWTPSGGAANIDGSVRSVSSLSSAIQMPAANVTAGLKPGSASQEIPHPDILGRVGIHSGDPALVTTPGQTALAPGDFYHGGDLNYIGDLVLDDANLYVNGSVNVTGTIKGTGSLFVTGNTTLYGDAEMKAAAGEQMSILSRGSVTLKGYDGSQYLASLDPAADASLRSEMGAIDAALRTGDPTPWIQGGIHDGRAATVRTAVNSLRAALSSEPASPAKVFLNKRLDLLSTSSNTGMFDWPYGGSSAPGPSPQDGVLDTFLADGTNQGGLFDAFNDRLPTRPAAAQAAILNQFLQMISGLNFRSPGSCVFVGQVYSNGFIYAENDLTVVGSLQTLDDGSQAPGTPDGSTVVRPGEMFLKKRTRVTFIQSQSGMAGSTVGTMMLRLLIQE